MPIIRTGITVKAANALRLSRRAAIARREAFFKRAANARRSVLLNRRGLLDFRIHKPSEYSKLKTELRTGKIPNFYISIGHGEHMPSEPKVKIPDNVYVVFFTKAGFPLRKSAVLNSEFVSIMSNKKSFIKFLTDDIKPPIVKNEGWHWTDHIYPPGSMCESHSLLFRDSRTDPTSQMYNKIAGTHTIGNNTQFNHHGETKSLQQLVDYASRKSGNKKCMLFLFGCRGDPRLSIANSRQRMNAFVRYFGKKQNYEIPYYPENTYIQNMQALERRIKNELMKIKYNETVIKNEIRKIPIGLNGMPHADKLSKLLKKYSNFFSRFNNAGVNRYVKNAIGYTRPPKRLVFTGPKRHVLLTPTPSTRRLFSIKSRV